MEDDDITSEEKDRIEEKMIRVAQMRKQRISLKGFGYRSSSCNYSWWAAAAILGSNTQISQKDDYDDDNNDVV